MGETEVTVRGRLGHNPELQMSAANKPWLRVRVATNRRIRTPEGWTDGQTSWYEVKLWGDFARNAAESLRKGDAVIVQGPLYIDEYTNEQSVTFRTAVIHANAFGPDLHSAVARVTKVQRNEAGQVVEPPPVDLSAMSEITDDIRDREEGDEEIEDDVEEEDIPELANA
ncbi:single-stranded DNA-binding protein [Pseudactinotalea suaedae]|uniref:single-stranded DNA-binding protein n=1 Tax=Pseudactinotalea suaedae TaxID=1524924 RepID=UPI0012E26073|nr:single-stranded DNA-binding protein [Pseudactinotalea suaedae]